MSMSRLTKSSEYGRDLLRCVETGLSRLESRVYEVRTGSDRVPTRDAAQDGSIRSSVVQREPASDFDQFVDEALCIILCECVLLYYRIVEES